MWLLFLLPEPFKLNCAGVKKNTHKLFAAHIIYIYLF